MIYILNKQKEKETLLTNRKLNLFLAIYYGQNSKLLSKIGFFREIPVRFGTIMKTVIKSTQCMKLVPIALRFTYQNLKSCKSHEKKMKQRTSDS